MILLNPKGQDQCDRVSAVTALSFHLLNFTVRPQTYVRSPTLFFSFFPLAFITEADQDRGQGGEIGASAFPAVSGEGERTTLCYQTTPTSGARAGFLMLL